MLFLPRLSLCVYVYECKVHINNHLMGDFCSEKGILGKLTQVAQ